MLDAIRESLDEFVSEGDMAATPQVTPQVKRLLAVCEGEQTGFAVKAFRNNIPSPARRSRFGVLTNLLP